MQWILDQEDQRFSLTHARVPKMTVQILRSSPDYEPPEGKWLQNFKGGNPHVKTCIGRKIKAIIIYEAHSDLISEFYTLFQDIQSRYDIRPQDIWNTDEHGKALGVCESSRKFANSEEYTGTLYALQHAEGGVNNRDNLRHRAFHSTPNPV